MGQSNSTEIVEEQRVSGVSLSPELEESIVRDFQNKTLQEEWDKFRTGVLTRRHERYQKMTAEAQELERNRVVAAAERAQRLASLDAAIEQMSAQFADESVALQYDLSEISKKFLQRSTTQEPGGEKPLSCLGPRAHWLDCAKKYASDTRPCDAYLETLEKCVSEAIIKSSKKLE